MNTRTFAAGPVSALALMAAFAFGCSEPELQSTTSELSRSLLDPSSQEGGTTTVAGEPAAVGDGSEVPVSEIGFNRGVSEAPVKIVEMSDYGCGYCRRFHEETFPTLRAEFIETGKVEWKFVPYITGMFDNSLVATEAAECSYAQDAAAFEELNRRLWHDQRAWKGSDTPHEVVRDWVSELGIDMAGWDACMDRDRTVPRVAASTELARQLGIRGTPTFVVLGYPPLQGALPLETFREVLTRVHADAVERVGASGG